MEPKLAGCITTHSFSFDNKLLAFSDATNTIYIYQTNSSPSKWKLLTTLSDHDSYVSSLSFHPSSYLLVSCSHDRNAYVWNPTDDKFSKWEHKLVITKLNRAALHVSWSPIGDRFAIASSSKVVSVCYYDKANNWWASNLIRKHRSSVTKVAWHPSGLILATACTDYRVRLCSAFNKRLDTKLFSESSKSVKSGKSKKDREKTNSDEPPSLDKPIQEDQTDKRKEALKRLKKELTQKIETFGEILGYTDLGDKSWVENVCFDNKGETLIFTNHLNKIAVVNLGEELELKGEEMSCLVSNALVKGKLRLFRDLQFINERLMVGVGFDSVPVILKIKEKEKKLDIEIVKELKPLQKITAKKESEFEKHTNVLEAKLTYAMSKEEFDKLKLGKNRHSSTIVEVEVGREKEKFSTCGTDGRVLWWGLKEYGIEV